MDVADWGSPADPKAALDWLVTTDRVPPRKLRLLGCACCRVVWHLMADPRSRRAVEVAEAFADGLVIEEELCSAFEEADAVAGAVYAEGVYPGAYGERAATAAMFAAHESASHAAYYAHANAALALAETYGISETESWRRLWPAVVDVVGNPHRPLAPIAPSLLAWNDGLVLTLAKASYDERLPSGHLDPARLAVLADGLLDAGCTDAELLDHLRSDGPHWRGCFAVDAVLGRA